MMFINLVKSSLIPESESVRRVDINHALDEVSANSAGGAPFLLAYGFTFLITAVSTFVLPRETTALIAMFQGIIALPLAFWMESKMGWEKMSPNNPFKQLSAQLAMAQALALPILIVAYNINEGFIPIMLAAIGGMHFFPYAWLQRTNLYLILGVVLSVGAFILQLLFGTLAYTLILFFVTAVYWIAAPLMVRHAKRLNPPQKI